ncbi:MAG: hypothetical protein HQL76_15115 [Magnetococcales bacterium]|nr:hypothetical protein [Magnetococcales bacterium]
MGDKEIHLQTIKVKYDNGIPFEPDLYISFIVNGKVEKTVRTDVNGVLDINKTVKEGDVVSLALNAFDGDLR